MGLHRKESRSFNGFGKILTKTIKITKTEIETKEKPQILHFQVKNTGFCQQSEGAVTDKSSSKTKKIHPIP